MRSAKLCVAALFVALLTVGSWITVPSAVPFTMQSFVMYLSVWLLPPAYAVASTAVYLLLGAIGLPVFAGFQGGLGVLFGPLGGFLWGFLLMAGLAVVWRVSSSRAALLRLVAGTALCYLAGAVWFSVYGAEAFSWSAFASSLWITVVPFVPIDAIKLLLAWQVGERLRRHLPS